MSGEERYDAHYAEIERRDAVAKSPQSLDDMQKLDSDVTYPYELPQQHFAVVSFATPHLTPFTTKRDTGIKVCGVFHSYEAAGEFARDELMSLGDSLAIRSLREWHIVPASAERLEVDLQRKQDLILDMHKSTQETKAREFEDRVKRADGANDGPPNVDVSGNRNDGGADSSTRRLPIGSSADGSLPPTTTTTTKAKRHPRHLEVRDQTYAVMSFVNDDTKRSPCNEFVFQIHGVFATEQEATVYMVNTASDVVKDVDMYIVPCYEWLVPSKMEQRDDNGKVFYRNRELQSLMREATGNRSKVDSYQAQCKRDGMEPAITRIETDRVTCANDAVAFVEVADEDQGAADAEANGNGSPDAQDTCADVAV